MLVQYVCMETQNDCEVYMHGDPYYCVVDIYA